MIGIGMRNRARIVGLAAAITVVAIALPLVHTITTGSPARAAHNPASTVAQAIGPTLARHNELVLVSVPIAEAHPASHAGSLPHTAPLSHAGVLSRTVPLPHAVPLPGMVIAATRARPSTAWPQPTRAAPPPPLVSARDLTSGPWLTHPSLQIAVSFWSARKGARLQPQIELRPTLQPLTDHPTMEGSPIFYTGHMLSATLSVADLRDGVSYHWRARAHDMGSGVNSAWTNTQGEVVRVHLTPPAAPALTLVTPAAPGNWVSTRGFTTSWSQPADPAGIAGYAYTLTRNPLAQPVLAIRAAKRGATFVAPNDGKWFVAVRALDRAGLWSSVARLKVEVDALLPRAQVSSVPGKAINPLHTPLVMRLSLNQPSWVYISVQDSQGQTLRTVGTPLRGRGPLSLTWDGRDDKGTAIGNGRDSLLINVRDRAGVVWTATRPLMIEESAPSFTGNGLTQTGSYNPYDNSLDGTEQVTATLDTPVHLRVEAIRDGQTVKSWPWQAIAAGQVYTATWNGMDAHGTVMPAGNYTFRLTARDDAGNESNATTAAVTLDRRRIVVSLNGQEMWALDGNQVLLHTLVTSGGPDLPTPLGDYQIIDRESPFTFHSPWPPGSPYWYADSPTNFALLFQADGYFIHDAPWRTVFGPGSNQTTGTPGGNYTGTHGCVNAPYAAMSWLWNWATMYTPVQVRQSFTP